MARTESTMVHLGTDAPAFELTDVISGRVVGRDDAAASVWDDKLTDGVNKSTHGGPVRKHGLLVMFVCPHCPYVKHVEQELGRLGHDYFGQGDGPIAMVAIMSNDLDAYPQDGPDAMREQAERNGWTFPYLLDPSQEVARSYHAACTPDFFLYDAEMKLVYRGQLDSSRPAREGGQALPVTGEDLRRAMDAVIHGKRPDPEQQRTSLGCNIKWREVVQA